jgi:outer membrane protein assembly factor BamB
MKSPVFARILIVLLVLLAGFGVWFAITRDSGGLAEDWTEFRGPSQDGHSQAKGLPTEWSAEKNVVWKTTLPGRAWSSPVVSGDRIFLTNAINEKDDEDVHAPVSLHVLALNAADGKQIWDKEVFFIKEPFSKGFHEKNSHASASPVYKDGRIYAHFATFGTACLDVDGNIIWKTQEPVFTTELGTGSCPVIVDDLLIFNCDGVEAPFVVALDRATGKERWRTLRDIKDEKKPKDLYALSTPLLIDVKGEKQLITVGTRVVQALSPKDGREIWRHSHPDYCAVPRPVFGQGLVFINTGFQHPSTFAINPDGKGDVSDKNLVWETGKNVPLTPSMLVVGPDLYMVSDAGMLSCLDAKTGKVWWHERVGKTTSASLFYGDGRIYLQDEFGKGYVIKPGHKLELIATNDLGDKSMASYSVLGNRLLIRTHHALWCIGKK